jgi:hypothetical protein
MHLPVDRTSVKLCGPGVWLVAEHDAQPRRFSGTRACATAQIGRARDLYRHPQSRCPDHLRVNRQQNLSAPAAPRGLRELDADKVLLWLA